MKVSRIKSTQNTCNTRDNVVFAKEYFKGIFKNIIYIRCQLRDGSRTTVTSKMELFVIIVNGFQLLTTITECSILDVAAILGPSMQLVETFHA